MSAQVVRRLLIAAPAADRLEAQIRDRAPSVRILRLEDCGAVSLDGIPLDDAGNQLEASWLSLDVFERGLLPRFIELVSNSTTLRWLQTVHAGLDAPFYRELLSRGVQLSNSHVHAPAIAEYVLGQVLAVLQNHEKWCRWQAECRWRPTSFREINGMNWLVVGAGHVGAEISRRARAFGAFVGGIRRRAVANVEFDFVATTSELGPHLAAADVVVLACALTAETRGLAGEGFFGAMKPGGIFVNVARGGLVDEEALIRGLSAGRPGFAVLDVTAVEPLPRASPLWRDDRVRLTAHSAYSGSGTAARSDSQFLRNLCRYCAGRPLEDQVSVI